MTISKLKAQDGHRPSKSKETHAYEHMHIYHFQ